jgi:hypothetical protein
MNKTTIEKELQLTLNTVLEHYPNSTADNLISPLGNGLINHTYLVKSGVEPFVLQRINDHVFQQPWLVTRNADFINQHLLLKKQQGCYPLATISQLKNKKNDTLLQLDSGYWRAIEFIPFSYSVEDVKTPEQAESVANAFAEFNAALSDFPAEKLSEIIPDFHHLAHRLQQLSEVISTDKVKRKSHCQTLIDYCFEQQNFIKEVADLIKVLPVKVTHNDTKINNLLFSSNTHKAIAVIDLDTCMPGFLMHDFGDMVRTCCSNLPEDGTALEQMTIRLDIFNALAKGYISTLDKHISKIERNSLIVGALLIPFMMAIRFLTDYLDGDNYFHIKHQEHNFERAKNQMQLFKLLSQQREQLSEIVATQ